MIWGLFGLILVLVLIGIAVTNQSAGRVLPLAVIVVIGIIAYFVFPHHGMVTGMILTACGSFGLLIFSMVLYNLAIKQSVSMTIIFLVAVELVTLFLGIISLIKIRIKKKHN